MSADLDYFVNGRMIKFDIAIPRHKSYVKLYGIYLIACLSPPHSRAIHTYYKYTKRFVIIKIEKNTDEVHTITDKIDTYIPTMTDSYRNKFNTY